MSLQPTNNSARRHFLASSAMSVSSVALAWMLKHDSLPAESQKPNLERQAFDTRPKESLSQPKADAMISLWMQGGPSHHDMFDPKPEVVKWDGQPFPGEIHMGLTPSEEVAAFL